MTIGIKKAIRFLIFLIPAIVMFGSYAVLFKIPGLGYLNIERLCYVILLFLALVYFIKKGGVTLRYGAAGKPVLFFIIMLVYGTVTLLWVNNIRYSYSAAYLYILTGVTVILLIPAAAQSLNDMKIILRVAAVCYIIAVIFGMVEIFTGHYLFTQNPNSLIYKNPYGLNFPYAAFYNTNDYSTFIVLFMPFAVYRIISDIKGLKGKIIAVTAALAGLFTVFNANARICYFAIAVFVLTFVIALATQAGMQKYIKIIFKTAGVIFAVFVVLLFTSSIKLNVFGSEMASINTHDHSIEERAQLFNAGLKMAADYNWMGVGVGNSVPLVPYYSDLQPINLHGMPLQIFTEYGIIIFILYGLTLLYLGIKFFKFKGKRKGEKIISCLCFASLCSFQLADFASSDATHVVEIWVVIAIWLAFLKIINQSPDEEKQVKV